MWNKNEKDFKGSVNAQPIVKGQAPKSPAPSIQGKDQKYVDSDVSGIKEDEEKRAKAKQK